MEFLAEKYEAIREEALEAYKYSQNWEDLDTHSKTLDLLKKITTGSCVSVIGKLNFLYKF